ncbi:MAG: glycosyltransferase [Anaerolineae bacterium]|nr:glycosyltransferase [Anaerolineae bacterium]
MTALFAIIYVVAALLLALYGANSLLLTAVYWRVRQRQPAEPPLSRLPGVTVQLPIYNEVHVVERLIDAVAQLDYPPECLQIQVLDDSSDETTALARARVEFHRARGVNIALLRRQGREGYKAGALAHGLRYATGELIALFDADFVPAPDFLRRTVPYFLADPGLGFLQTRWGHLNADYSPLTRAQALALDGHFVVEQTARQRSGWFMNFNGTAGLWRRACIEESGGWSADTLSEDLDLSYRAQVRGWRAAYLPQVVAPAEVPPQLAAFKRQQFRWAKGSIQCLRKLAGEVWRSSRSLAARLEGLVHLSGYLAHPLMVLMLLSTLPLLLSGARLSWPLAYLSLASLGPPLLYAVGQRALYPNWWRRYSHLPLLVLLGSGIALSNSVAIVEGLLGRENRFRRTPKFRLEGKNGQWQGQRYALRLDWMVLGELLLALYAALTIAVAWTRGHTWAIPFLCLYLGGFGLMAIVGLWQAIASAFPARAARKATPLVQRPAGSPLAASPSAVWPASRR